jgi:RNA polymerase sigma-70 factor (ECF subfamily)
MAEVREARNEPFGADDIASLLERSRNGDREAFLVIVRAYQRRVFAIAYALLRDKEDALDAVQETFLKLYEKAGTFRAGRSFQAWLYRIARNVCIDHYRKNRRPSEAWDTGQALEDVAGPADQAGPDSVGGDLLELLRRSVDRLAERQRQVFVMRHFDELRFSEISTALNISEGTAKSLHFKAVQNLKKRLAPQFRSQT